MLCEGYMLSLQLPAFLCNVVEFVQVTIKRASLFIGQTFKDTHKRFIRTFYRFFSVSTPHHRQEQFTFYFYVLVFSSAEILSGVLWHHSFDPPRSTHFILWSQKVLLFVTVSILFSTSCPKITPEGTFAFWTP